MRELRSGDSEFLVTSDTGMTVRAWSQETEVVEMPEKYLRRKMANKPEPVAPASGQHGVSVGSANGPSGIEMSGDPRALRLTPKGQPPSILRE